VTELDGTELVDWRELPPGQRRGWWEQLWEGVTAMADRYRLALRSDWWQDAVQVEALAAFVGWLRLYDTGAYNDPPGKLQLLWELERLRAVLRAGEHAFDYPLDRASFEDHLDTLEHPGGTRDTRQAGPGCRRENGGRRGTMQELVAVTDRLRELRERRDVLEATSESRSADDGGGVRRDLCELRDAIEQLTEHERRLRAQVDGHG
jgi:hypothetical protein